MHTANAASKKPNILFITVDDMSCDSIGVYGCKLPNTTPNIDKLAAQSLRFQYAHVESGSCMPSRNAMFSGRYSHNNKVEGFYQVKDPGYPVMADLMHDGGYFTGIRHKVSHSTPYSPYKWDLVMDSGETRPDLRNAASYHTATRKAIDAAKGAGKPFCFNINIADPHKPFYAEGRNGETIPDKNVPSLVFKPEEVPIPGFLFDDPVVRKELAHYYSSVRRADDCLAEILKALKESGEEENTVVIFLSDHGMPLPFAKTQVYHHSTWTPWMVRWPGVTKPGSVDTRHMIEGIDILPTFLDIGGVKHPKGMDGRSIVPILKGKTQKDRDMVFKEHNENSGGNRSPMRAVQTKEYLYIFSPWSDGKRIMSTATAGTSTWRRMLELAKTDKNIAARVDLMQHRVPEEFYNVSKDPDALNNLINDPASQKELTRLRNELEKWMKRTGEPMLATFQKRTDAAARNEYMKQFDEQNSEKRGGKKNRRNKEEAE